MMRKMGAAFLLLLAMAGQGEAAPVSVPHRIMSLKICTDELLMDLAPPSHIASVTFLSREAAALKLWPEAAHIPVNHNSPEEVLATRPDMVLTDSFTSPQMRTLLAKSGARVVEVPPAENFDQIRADVRLVAKAVGEEARGEALIARMDAKLRALAAHRPAKPLIVAGWGGGGYVPGRGGMFDALLTAAGARNVERHSFGYYDVESLIAANPDALVYDDTYAGTASLRDDQDLHPALMRRYAGKRIHYAGFYDCGVPESAGVAQQLQDALRHLQGIKIQP
jgi:iron complex transport system substrate-binding protein